MVDFTLTVLSHKHMLQTSNRWYRGLAIEITQHYNLPAEMNCHATKLIRKCNAQETKNVYLKYVLETVLNIL